MWFAQSQLRCTLQSVPNATASLVTKLHATSASTDFQFLTIYSMVPLFTVMLLVVASYLVGPSAKAIDFILELQS